jgi:hypothetical protein
MELDEKIITQAIIDRYFQTLKENLSVDVTIVWGRWIIRVKEKIPSPPGGRDIG